MALGTFIAGRYATTINSVDVGLCEEGYTLSYELKRQLINRSDAFGDSLIDTIERGGDWTAAMDAMEFKTVTINAIGQVAAMGTTGVIGRLGSNIAQALVMTATASTPAAAAPATLTATKALLMPSGGLNLLFNSALRKVPLRFAFLLIDSGGGVMKHFTMT